MAENHVIDRTTGLSNRDVVDISSSSIAMQMLKGKAYHDKLLRENAKVTYNGKKFNENTGIYSVMFGDANFLKLINDFLGHPTGDIELKNLADIMASCIRTHEKTIEGPEHRLEKADEEDTVFYGSHLSDIITARYGGDEFLIILPNCTKKNAELIKNRINFAIEKSIELKKHDLTVKGIDPDDVFSLTITFGIADTNELPIPATISNETLEKYFVDIVGKASDRMDAEKKERAKNMDEQELLPINAALLGRLYDVNGTKDIETIIRRLRSSNEFRNNKLDKRNTKEK